MKDMIIKWIKTKLGLTLGVIVLVVILYKIITFEVNMSQMQEQIQQQLQEQFQVQRQLQEQLQIQSQAQSQSTTIINGIPFKNLEFKTEVHNLYMHYSCYFGLSVCRDFIGPQALKTDILNNKPLGWGGFNYNGRLYIYYWDYK